MRDVVDDQEDELELMRRNRVLEQGVRAPAVSSAFNAEFQEGFSQQQREIAELRGLIQVILFACLSFYNFCDIVHVPSEPAVRV